MVNNQLPVRIDVLALKPGMYIIHLSDGELLLKGKFIKQ
ncbi:T9SS type A sorting domain-containing protein [Paraflavitalea speifideaquila]